MKAFIEVFWFAVIYIHKKAKSGKRGSLNPRAAFSAKASFADSFLQGYCDECRAPGFAFFFCGAK